MSESKMLYVENVERDGVVSPLTDRRYMCCLCGSSWQGFGNNPDPLGNVHSDRCCGPCNTTQVLPARLNAILEPPTVE